MGKSWVTLCETFGVIMFAYYFMNLNIEVAELLSIGSVNEGNTGEVGELREISNRPHDNSLIS